MNSKNELKNAPLGVLDFNFSDLYRPDRLKTLHEAFIDYLKNQNPETYKSYVDLQEKKLGPVQESSVLIALARVLGDFIAKLFHVTNHAQKIKAASEELHPVSRFKKEFLNTRVFKRFSESPLSNEVFKELDTKIQRILKGNPEIQTNEVEVQVAKTVIFLLDSQAKLKTQSLSQTESLRVTNLILSMQGQSTAEKIEAALKLFEDWSTQLWVSPDQRPKLDEWISFTRAKKLDFENLVEMVRPDKAFPEKTEGPSAHHRCRDGFKLTDERMSTKEYLRETDYCIFCHERQKDSCSKGFPEKDGGFKQNPLQIPLAGCPLDERISEMHRLRYEGELIASLAMIMLDNPMCPGTGHRICNDCMKGCIFQKQEPVNIPQTETGTLTDVLNLPFGFEIYSLLTRFNPLNIKRPYALPYNGKNILVVGLGPAGYTLAHYLANEGFGVVGIDGLKLEPMKNVPLPLQNYSDLKKSLDERVLMGFGGVSEYGITVRWDKNFLSVIYLALSRRENVKFYGGVRFGGTLKLDDAWDIGFDHVALATGAGKPTIIQMKNNLSKGIRKASDFLMALQLTGAFKEKSLANLQVRLPAIVIGGGLTAIDTATEILAYYPIQVEKTLTRYETLVAEFGEELIQGMCDAEEKEMLTEFLSHAKEFRKEKELALQEKRKPNLAALCKKFGGVSVAYRKRLQDSPAYRLNHEEVEKAFEEGISFIENVTPLEAVKDNYSAVKELIFQRSNSETITVPARSVMVAAGTSPNTIYEREYPGTFNFDAKKNYFQKYRINKSDGKFHLTPAKPEERAFFLSYEKDGKFVSFYGDNHPDYAGNVVKAMASAKHGAPQVAQLFEGDIIASEKSPTPIQKFKDLTQYLDSTIVPKVVSVERLTSNIVEVVVNGKYIARQFEPGQFYRVQNYETKSHMIDGSKLSMEGLALTGAWVDKDRDLLSLIVLEMGGSSRLCAALKPGEPVVVMGPTGAPSEIPENETVLLVGGGLGNAVLLSIAKACREKGSKVIYFAGYKKAQDLFKKAEIESNTDQIIWSVDPGSPPIDTSRPQDISFVGNIVQCMQAYAGGKLKTPIQFPFETVDRMIVIGSDRMMAAVHAARSGVLKPYLKEGAIAIGSINSPMQCMMKEVCAQCLQRHVDPKTGKEHFVFSCFNQDQNMDLVDWKNLNDRLKTNSLQEKLTNKYLDYLFLKGKIERI